MENEQDEQTIRKLVDTWLATSRAGDLLAPETKT
jgi:ketosteroid isomerase-like protein